jgi:hypothetical protein
MQGSELRSIRRSLGLTVRELGYAIGYRGNHNTVSVAIRLYEGDKKPIPLWIGLLASMFGRHGVPPEWTLGPNEPFGEPLWIWRLVTMFGRHGVPPEWTLPPDRPDQDLQSFSNLQNF